MGIDRNRTSRRSGPRRPRTVAHAIGWLPVLALSACTAVGPNYKTPETAVPSAWSADAQSADAGAPGRVSAQPADIARWWLVFHDPVLEQLIDEAARQNLDVQTAALRIAAARQQLRDARGAELPQVAGSVLAGRTRMSENGLAGALSGGGGVGGGAGGGGTGASSGGAALTTDLYQAGFDATWELDLWGKVRRSVEAAGAGVESAEEARHDALASLSAEIARGYFALRSTQRQLAIVREDIATQQRLLQLVQSSSRAGLSPQAEVAAQSAQLQSVLAQVPTLEQNLSQTRNRLALLLALPPGALDGRLAERPRLADLPSTRTDRPMARANGAAPAMPASGSSPEAALPPTVPVGLPGDLLRRRPDVRRSEAELHAATAKVGVATSALFPSITLGLSTGLQSVALGDLTDWGSRFFLGGALVSLPIFQGGHLKAQVALADINMQQSALAYRKTVLGAFHEADGALVTYGQEQQRTIFLSRQLDEALRTRDLATGRWRSGLASYIDVLDAQRQAHRSELQLAQSQALAQTDLVALFKALGGGWTDDAVASATSP